MVLLLSEGDALVLFREAPDRSDANRFNHAAIYSIGVTVCSSRVTALDGAAGDSYRSRLGAFRERPTLFQRRLLSDHLIRSFARSVFLAINFRC